MSEQTNPLSFSELDAVNAEAKQSETTTNVRRALSIAAPSEPDTAAKNLFITERTGLPADTVQRNTSAVENKLKITDAEIQSFFEDGPEAKAWKSDPQNMKLISDDFSLPARWGNSLKGFGMSAYKGMTSDFAANLYGTLETTSANIGFDPTTKFFRDLRVGQQQISKGIEQSMGPAGYVESGVRSGFSSLGQQIPALLLSVVTRNPQPMLTSAGINTFGASSTKALDAGKSPAQAALYGGSDAAIEIGTEMLPIAKLIGDAKVGSSFFTMLFNQLKTEIPGELAATTLQNLNEWAVINPEKPFSSYLEQLPADLGQTLIATMTSVGLTTGIAKGLSGRPPRTIQDPEAVKQSVLSMNNDVRSDVLHQRSPERFKSLLTELAPNEQLYINAEALQNFMVSLPEEVQMQIVAQVPNLKVELENAAVTGADVVMSKADYATYLSQHPQADNLADFIKLDPQDLTASEQQIFTQVAQQNPELLQGVEQAQPQAPEMVASIERVVRKAMVDSGRSQLEAKAVAPLFAKTFARFAAPLSMNEQALLTESLLQFQNVDAQGNPIKVGSNFGVMLEDLGRIRAGKNVRLDERGRAAVEDFGQRLDAAGITPEQAKTMQPSQVFDMLYPQQQGGTETELSAGNESRKNIEEYLSQSVGDNNVVETPQFKEWFGNSKVVDAQGNPVVVYHGTDKKFTTINPKKGAQGLFWFTSDKSKIEEGEVGASGRGQIMDLFASIQNPAGWKEYDNLTLDELEARGYDGVILPNSDGTFEGFVFDGNKVKSASRNRGTFDKDSANILKQTERGSIAMTKSVEGLLKKAVISFTEQSDFSTAVHEFSHWAVAMHRQFAEFARERQANGATDPEIARIVNDWETLKQQVGASSDAFTVEQEEEVARMFEAYMREGQAPSDGLRRVFARFRDWLTKIYRDLRALNVEINPEVTGIFDRWLASEEEIAEVRNRNDLVTQVAMSLGIEGTVEKVSDYVNSAMLMAEEKLYRELSAEQKRRETKAYKEEFAKVREVVAEEYAQKPVYSAMNFLKENGLRLFIDPSYTAELGVAPNSEFSGEDAQPVPMETLEAYANDSLDAEARREAVISMLLAKKPKKPISLISFFVKRGGLKEQSGELLHIFDKKVRRPGLINNKSGLDLDMAREAAVEAKYLSPDADINALLDALRNEEQGNAVYSERDYDKALNYQSYQQAQDEADLLGIDINFERLRRRKYGNYSDIFTDDESNPAAVYPDEIAELYGFKGGRELITELRNAPNFDNAVDAQTRKRLDEKFPDMIDSGRIQNKAVDAILNDKVILALDVMIKELGKQYGNARVSMKQFAKVMAQQQLAKMKVKEIGYAYRYEIARERELRLALQESRNSNTEKALLHLQRALVNQTLYKSMREFQETQEKAMALFKRVDEKDKALAPTVDIDFIGAARHVLNKFGLGGQRFNYARWIEDLQARDPNVAEDLVNLSAMEQIDDKPANELTTSEFMDVYNTIQTIYAAARNLKEFEIGGKKVATDTAVGELVQQMGTIAAAPETKGTRVYGIAKLHANVMALKGVMRRVESWTKSMDDGYGGPFRTYIWQPISDASVAYRSARNEWMKGLNDIFKSHREHLLKKGKVNAQEMGLEFSDRRELIGFLLHTGNESNLEKLLGGYGIQRQQFEGAMKSMQADGRIGKEDFELVQKLWNYAEALKPISQRAHKKLYGYRFDEIEPTPIETSFGTYRGGYWPAVVDYEQVDTKDVERMMQDAKHFALATTNKGFTKGRVRQFQKKLSTDLRLSSNHIDQVLRFAYLEPAVRQVARVINKQSFKDTLKGIDSQAFSVMLMPWLQRTAAQQVSEPIRNNGKNLWGRAGRWLRQSVSAQAMMGNIVNALQNFTSFPIIIYRVGPRNFSKAFAQYMTSPIDTAKQIHTLSKMMQARQNVLDIDVSNELNEIINRTGPYTKVRNFTVKHGYVFQRMTQGFIDNIAWMSAYTSQMEEGVNEADAVRYADSVVRETQASGAPEDISEIEASSELGKVFLMFYTYFNNIGNMVGTEARTIMREQGWQGSPKLFYLYMMTVAIPAVLGDGLVRALRNDPPGDDDEDGEILDDWLTFMAGAQLRYVSATVPYAGQAFNALYNSMVTKKTYDDRISASPIISYGESAFRFVSRMAGDGYEDNSQMIRDGMNTLGFLTGLPIGQLGKPAAFLANVEEGDESPDNAALFTRGLIGGPTPSR